MALENIRTRILEAAQAEADAVLRAGEAAARKQLDQAVAGNDARFKKAEAEIRARLRQQHDRDVTAANAANRLELLVQKSEILNQFFDAAVERFVGRRDGDYRQLLARQLDSVAGETGAVVAAAADRAAIEQLLAELKKQNRGAGLSVAEESRPLRGGFILQGEKTDIDLSLDTWLADVKEELMPEMARRAFGEGKIV